MSPSLDWAARFQVPLFIDRHGRSHYLIGGASPDGDGPDGSQSGQQAGQSGQSNQPGQGQQNGGEPQVNEHGYPERTPWTQMTSDQQVAYWRHQSQKHEGRANARQDYDQIKAERDQLRTAGQTAEQQAIDAAREEGRTVARRELGEEAVTIHVNALATVGRLTHEAAETLLSGLDRSKFLTADGQLDDGKLSSYLDLVAPKGGSEGQPGQRRDPHQGNRQNGGARSSGVAAGAEMFASRKQKQTTNS